LQDTDAGYRSYIGIGCSRWGESHSPYRTFQVSAFKLQYVWNLNPET
jgi:hypothetical protein